MIVLGIDPGKDGGWAIVQGSLILAGGRSPQMKYGNKRVVTDGPALVRNILAGAEQAEKQIDAHEANGFGNLPVCIAKTHLSISSNAALKGAPTGWTLPVREVRASIGAGFVYPICGDMRTMPGLGSKPGAMGIDIDENGEIVGLS